MAASEESDSRSPRSAPPSPPLTSTFPVAPSPAFGALRNPNFRYFIAGQFISLCGTWMQTVALGWLALELTNSALQVGLVTFFGALPVLLFTLWGGVVAGRVNKRSALLLLQFLFLAEALALGFLTATGRITIEWVYALSLAGGVISAFEIPIRQAFLGELAGREHLMSAIAMNSSAFNVSRVFGPALAGTLLAAAGAAACFFVNAASFLAVLAGLFRIDRALGRRVVTRSKGIRDGMRHVFGSPWPRALIVLTSLFTIFGVSFVAILPVFARDVLGTGAGGYGALTSGFGVGAAAGAISIAALGHRFRREPVLLWSGTGFAAAVFLLGLTRVFALAFPLMVVAGLCLALTAILTNTMLQTEAPEDLRGQVVGFYSFIVVGMAPFGSLQAGWLAEHLGAGTAVLLGGAVCLLASAGARRYLGRVP
jgi:MFS family permease